MTTAMQVKQGQRHTRGRPCQICQGHADMRQGEGRRCAGYRSADGEYEHCQREQYAGRLQLNEHTTPPTYAHKLHGACDCGTTHASAAPHTPNTSSGPHDMPMIIRYRLYDSSGKLVGIHCRKETVQRVTDGLSHSSKTFWWSEHDGRGAEEMPLYGLPNLMRASPGGRVYVTEGEKAADALAKAGVVAVATVTGANGTPCDEALEPLVGREVTLWPDNDDVGRKHMERIADRLVALGASAPKWVCWKDAPAKGDAADYVACGGTVAELEAVVTDKPAQQAAEQPKVPTASKDAQSEQRASLGIFDEEGHLWKGIVTLSEVTSEQVQWLWQGRIPLGKLTIVDGNSDLGKSIVFGADLPARITTGDAMPDGTPGLGTPAGVVLLSAEDGLADTIRPRLDAAGADVSRVVAIESVPRLNEDGSMDETSFFIPRDLGTLRKVIEHIGARYVLIDPLMAYLHPGEVNSYRDQDVRTALAPLVRLAAETGAAIVAIRHLNKSAAASPLYRGGGSIGIIAAARSGLIVAKDPDNENRRILARSKGNLAAPVAALAYHIEVTADGVPYIVWEGATEHTADQLLAVPAYGETRTETDEAVEWLRNVLDNAGGQLAAMEVQAKAKQEGISEKVLRSARLRICAKPAKEGFGSDGGWQWALAPRPVPKLPIPPKMPKDAHSSSEGILGEGGHLNNGHAHICPKSGHGQHVYAAMRTANGRRVCIECDQPEERHRQVSAQVGA